MRKIRVKLALSNVVAKGFHASAINALNAISRDFGNLKLPRDSVRTKTPWQQKVRYRNFIVWYRIGYTSNLLTSYAQLFYFKSVFLILKIFPILRLPNCLSFLAFSSIIFISKIKNLYIMKNKISMSKLPSYQANYQCKKSISFVKNAIKNI